MADAASEGNPTIGVDVNDLVPFCGCACFMTSCYTEWPDMVGCAGKDTILCINRDFLACKFPKNPDHWWLCGQGTAWLEKPSVCCSERVQACCLDVRGSIPCTDEVPCMITICFFTAFYKSKSVMQFMKPVKDLEAAAGSA